MIKKICAIIMSFLILGYLWHYDEKIKAHSYINKVLGIVADYSFAIFFLHYYNLPDKSV